MSYCARRRLAKHYFSDAWTQARAQRWRARLKRSRAQGCSGAARDGVQARARWSECWDVLRWQWSYWQKSRRARSLSLSQSVSGSSSGNRRQRQGGCCWWAARRSSRVRLVASRSGGASKRPLTGWGRGGHAAGEEERAAAAAVVEEEEEWVVVGGDGSM